MVIKKINELLQANAVNPNDLFVLQQGNTAKALTGQTLENWLLSLQKVHGTIKDWRIDKTGEFTFNLVLILTDNAEITVPMVNGKDGESAYELAVKHGFSGTEAQWIELIETSARKSADAAAGSATAAGVDADRAKSEAEKAAQSALDAQAIIDDSKIGLTSTLSSKKSCDLFGYPLNLSGAVVQDNFIENYPLEVISKIEPKQEGEGEPSPDNVRNIVPWTGAKLTKCGEKILNIPDTNFSESGINIDIKDGKIHVYGRHMKSGWINFITCRNKPLPFNTKISCFIDKTIPVKLTAILYGAIYNELIGIGSKVGNATLNDKSTTLYFGLAIPENQDFDFEFSFVVTCQQESYDFSIYKPYNGTDYTMQFGQDVYGGEFDWETGKLSNKFYFINLLDYIEYLEIIPDTNSIFLQLWKLPVNLKVPLKRAGIALSSHVKTAMELHETGVWINDPAQVVIRFNIFPCEKNIEAFSDWLRMQNTAGTPFTLCLERKEYSTLLFSPQEIPALKGISTLYSDTGDTQVIGAGDMKAYIDKKFAELQSATVNNI